MKHIILFFRRTKGYWGNGKIFSARCN